MNPTLTLRTLPIERPDWPHAARSAYVEQFWLPTLGPTATALIRLGAGVKDDVVVGDFDLAAALGVSRTVLVRACQRVSTFRCSVWRDTDDERSLTVFSHLPWITPRQAARLPGPLQSVHRQMLVAA